MEDAINFPITTDNKIKTCVRSGIRTHASIQRPERLFSSYQPEATQYLKSGALDHSAILTHALFVALLLFPHLRPFLNIYKNHTTNYLFHSRNLIFLFPGPLKQTNSTLHL